MKRFLSDVKDGVVPRTLWPWQEVGSTRHSKQELSQILDLGASSDLFITPKPVALIRRILQIATDKNSIVLDSFAGSGTTGHAVLAQNKEDGGNRRFITVEMDEIICRTITAQRTQRVVEGHNNIEALGSGFRFCALGDPLFDESGNIREGVKFSEIAAHVFFTETGSPLPATFRSVPPSPLLGVHEGKAVYLLFNGVLGDKRPSGGNVLTSEVLKFLPPFSGIKVIYGEGCRLSDPKLSRENVVFKQVPYQIKVN
jgi:site-specific DNA-methyltransferase (adenine-specific)/adenine-specific DNA-methyltransferase